MDDVAWGEAVSGVDFSDEESALAWFTAQPVAVRSAISSRIALRTFADISRWPGEYMPELLLKTLRAVLTSTVRGAGRNLKIDFERVHSIAYSAAHRSRDTAISPKTFAVAAAAFSAAHSADPAVASPVLNAVRSNIRRVFQFNSRIHSAARVSATNTDADNDAITKFATPVWPVGTIPEAIARNHETLLAFFNENRATWGFWHDWYLAMWEGRFTDWDIAHEVALISDEVWEAGAEAVAVEIERIKARRALEAEIAALKAQLKQTQAAEPAHNRLHNNPPEAIESQQLKSEITLIWELLEDTEREIAKPSPSPSALRAIADTLWEISLRIGNYCASLADIALKKSAEVIGETGTKAGIAVLVTTTTAQNEGVKSVVNAIWEFVKTLPAG